MPTKRKITPQAQGGRVLPKLSDVEQRFADAEAEAVMAYARSREGRLEAQKEVQEALEDLPARLPQQMASQVEPLPSLQQALQPDQAQAHLGGPSNAELLAQPSSPRAGVSRPVEPAAGGDGEPAAKRSRGEASSLRRMEMVERRMVEVEFGEDACYHLDEVYTQENIMALEELGEKEDETDKTQIPEELWSDEPLNRPPPEPTPEVDRKADEIEVQRLKKMGVLAQLENGEAETLGRLTTRMVYDWRIKDYVDKETGKTRKRWMRRARLVAREYAHQRRDDVHSPASGSQSLRLLPMMYLMMRSMEGLDETKVQIGSLDIKDAFLQVEQEKPVQVSTKIGQFRVDRNLPGQRIGAKAWFTHVTVFLESCGFSFCKENPCLGRRDDNTYILIHVDDIMFCGLVEGVDKLKKQLQEKFNISFTAAQFEGDKFEFLKRTYILKSDGLDILPGRYGDSMVEAFEKRYGPVRLQSVPCSDEAQEISSTHLLPADEAVLYRSLVGSGIYLSQERIEVAFVIKQLAGGMSSPTQGHLQVMKKLVGYLKATKGYYNHLDFPIRGKGVHHHYEAKLVLESFTDADWSGNRQTRRSTSSAIHCLCGGVLYHSSRGQKVVSLSSAESELHSLTSGATDGIFIRRCLQFLTQEEIYHTCLVDNSATRQIANKRGNGKLRHVSGKELWVQDQVAMREMDVKQVSTLLNIADVGTKPLGKARVQALLSWCNVRDKEGNLVGEDEAARAKESHLTKSKVMRVAKMLCSMMIAGSLEPVEAMEVSVPIDVAVIEAEENYVVIFIQYISGIFFIVVFFVMVHLLREQHRLRAQLGALQREVQEEFQGLRNRVRDQSNEVEMQHLHVTAMHVGIVRLGGFVDIQEEIRPEDWDNWNYIEQNNIRRETYRCRRLLRDLRADARTLRRRQTTPPSRPTGRLGQFDENLEQAESEDEDPGDGPNETASERRRRYVQSTMSECSDPDEWADIHYGAQDPGAEQRRTDSPSSRSWMCRRSRSRTNSRRSSELRQTASEHDESNQSDGSEDTLREDYMAHEYLEWPRTSWRDSADRAQLDANDAIMALRFRAIRAGERGDLRMSEWLCMQTSPHLEYSRGGNLDMSDVQS